MDMLTQIEIDGFKSIRTLHDLKLGSLNVLIGANGSGKSNFISFFKLLNSMVSAPGSLQLYIGKSGGANTLLYDGARVTPHLKACLTFQTGSSSKEYLFQLDYAVSDTLVFSDERIRSRPDTIVDQEDWLSLGVGHREANIITYAEKGNSAAKHVLTLLKQCKVYQFHNTSETARIRQRWDRYDDHVLKEDGANLAPFLCRLRDTRPKYYTRIVETIRHIAPFFADFVLKPVDGTVLLQWQERGTDMLFGSHQASDGTLRVMALISLLLQPEDELPLVLIIDEPELGLHPYAINVLAGLLESVSTRTQVVLATQSMTLIDHIAPSQIVVVDRPDRQSTFRHLDEDQLKEWLEEYSLAELWEKNVLGGRPSV